MNPGVEAPVYPCLFLFPSLVPPPMPVLQRCWTPHITKPWTSVKYGSYYTAVYSMVFHTAAILFFIFTMQPSTNETHEHSFFFYEHLSVNGATILKWSFIGFFVVVIMATSLLLSGINKDSRKRFVPWLVMVSIEILVFIALGIAIIATSYSRMYPIVFALALWAIDCLHVYLILCVISQYQVLADVQEPRFVALEQ